MEIICGWQRTHSGNNRNNREAALIFEWINQLTNLSEGVSFSEQS